MFRPMFEIKLFNRFGELEFYSGSSNRELIMGVSFQLYLNGTPHAVFVDGVLCRIYRGKKSPVTVATPMGRIYRRA